MEQIRIKHSGNVGDLIYSLPAMREASKQHDAKVDVILRINVPMQSTVKHPNNGVQLTRTMAEMVTPLLMTCDFIDSVVITEHDEPCDYDFDIFRRFHNYTGHISQWYFHIYPHLTCDLSQPLDFDIEAITPERPIILNRTARYHNPSFDYSILRPFQHLITFVGLPDEYRIMSAKLPEITYTEVTDFKQLTALIKGAELFIGNQSMAFAIAEQMKSLRYLEICPYANNVIPTGMNGYGCFTVLNLIQLMKTKYGTEKSK